MLGACYLTEWTEGLEHMYDLGEEIETFRTPEELAEKLGKLQREPDRRRILRERGQRRAVTNHCVPSTLKKIAATLGIHDQ